MRTLDDEAQAAIRKIEQDLAIFHLNMLNAVQRYRLQMEHVNERIAHIEARYELARR